MSEPPVSPLILRLFGPFELLVNGRPLPRLRSRKGQWLLALLALRSGAGYPRSGWVERGWLAGTLWPESTETQALNSLRVTLADLRRALGAAAGRIEAPTPQTLRLDLAGAEVDLLAFDAAIARGDAASVEEAMALYRGPLLEGCTEEWAFEERQAREQAVLQALERLAAEVLAAGQADRAEGLLRRAVGVDPLREGAQRALMQTLAARGSWAGVVQTYRELRERLHRELNAEPDPETRALFERLRAEARRAAETGGRGQERSDARGGTGRREGVVRSFETFAHNLPVQLTSFIGREAPIAEVKRLLRTTRLLTLTGAGGAGKTRLSLQVAADLVDDFADGVWLVELAPLSDPELVPQVVASALGVREERGRLLTQTLIENFRPRRLLLLLDNCEHLIEASARLVEALLRGCPELVLLATSREPLGIGGETSYRVPPLSLPDPEEMTRLPADPALLTARYESARLFVERAQSLVPGFRVTPQSARSLMEICRRLDGMPLAIELAAARVPVLSLEQIAARVDDAIRLLTGGSRTALPRHQTLGALIDWSYNLLSERERVLLRRLSVFAGGWDLEAAEAVVSGQWSVVSDRPDAGSAGGAGIRTLTTDHSLLATDVLDLLSRLVDKSLVTADAQDEGETRFRLRETVRQYGQRKLEAAGELAVMRERHLYYFLRVVEEAYPGFFGATQLESARRLERNLDNLRTALAACGEEAVPPLVGLRLAGALWWFWNLQGSHTEARRWLEPFLARAGGRSLLVEAQQSRDPEAGRATARALLAAGAHAMFLGDFDPARRDLDASVALWRQQEDVWKLALALRSSGWVSLGQDDYGAAQSAGEESIVLYRQIGDEAGLARSLNLLAQLARRRSDYARAAGLWDECLTFARRSGDRWVAATALVNLAKIAEKQGDLPRARSLYQDSLRLRRALGDKSGIADCLEGLAAIILPSDGIRLVPDSEAPLPVSPEAAAQMFGAAAALREALGAGWSSPIEWPVSRADVVADLRATLGEPGFTRAWALGRSMKLDRVLAMALPDRDSGPAAAPS